MKKTIVYSLLFLALIGTTAFIVMKNKTAKTSFLPLKERVAKLASSDEYKTTKQRANTLLEAISKDPTDNKSKLELASLYIQEARITGDHVYYDEAAMKLANAVLTTDSANFEALVFKGTIYLSQHHFADALVIAEKVQQLNPYNAFVYGMLIDANVELGNYEAAIANADKMMEIRPDIRSYARVSYLREIHGDNEGAIEAMKLAVAAGVPGDEGTEWARIHLGQLYENTGDIQNAKMHYTIALQERPDYAYGLAGLGRIAMADKNYKEAISYFKKADELVIDYSLKDQLTELYALDGNQKMAKENAKEVIALLAKDAESGIKDENIGHYADKELAYAYLKTNELDKALEHAILEYNRRPGSIEVNEALAWVYFQKSDFANAKKHIDIALKTESKNPTLLCRAGLIYAKTNDKAKATVCINKALEKSPNIDIELKEAAQKIVLPS